RLPDRDVALRHGAGTGPGRHLQRAAGDRPDLRITWYARPVALARTRMDKTILITGASRGIGAACALLAARRGYTVCVNYRENEAAAHAVVRAIEAAGGHAFAVAAD